MDDTVPCSSRALQDCSLPPPSCPPPAAAARPPAPPQHNTRLSTSASSIRLSTWHGPHLLLSAVLRPRAAAPLLVGARRQRLSIDMPARRSQQQIRCTPLLRSNGGTDRRTNGQTDGRISVRYIDPAPHAMRTVPTSVAPSATKPYVPSVSATSGGRMTTLNTGFYFQHVVSY